MALRYPLLPLSTGLSCYTVQAAVHCLKSRMFVQLMTSCFSCYHVLMYWCLFISWSSVHVIMFSCTDVCLSHDLMFMLSWDLMFLYSHVLIKMLNEWTGWYPLSYYVYVSTCGAKMVYDKGRFPDAGSAHFSFRLIQNRLSADNCHPWQRKTMAPGGQLGNLFTPTTEMDAFLLDF